VNSKAYSAYSIPFPHIYFVNSATFIKVLDDLSIKCGDEMTKLLEPHRVTRRYEIFRKAIEYIDNHGCDHLIIIGWNINYSTANMVRYLGQKFGITPVVAASKIPNEPWIIRAIEEYGRLIPFEDLHAKAIYILVDDKVIVIETSSNPTHGNLIEHYSVQLLSKTTFLNRTLPIRRLIKTVYEGETK